MAGWSSGLLGANLSKQLPRSTERQSGHCADTVGFNLCTHISCPRPDQHLQCGWQAADCGTQWCYMHCRQVFALLQALSQTRPSHQHACFAGSVTAANVPGQSTLQCLNHIASAIKRHAFIMVSLRRCSWPQRYCPLNPDGPVLLRVPVPVNLRLCV